MFLQFECSVNYSTIVQCQLLYQHHGRSQGALGPSYPKYMPIIQNGLLLLSEHGDVIETRTINSVPGTYSNVQGARFFPMRS